MNAKEAIEAILVSECRKTALKTIALVENKHSDEAEQLTVLGIALCALAKLHRRSRASILASLSKTWDEVSFGEVNLDAGKEPV